MWAGYAAWHGASSSAWAPAACYALSVGAIWGWRRGRSCGAFCSAWCHIHWWRPSGCREGCVLGDTCAGGRVGVAALGGVPRARRQTMDGVDKSSVAATSHTRAAAASTAMTRCNKHNLFVAIEHFSTADQLERHTGTPHTTMPTAMNCLLTCCLLRAFLLVLLRHCILVEFLCTLQHATQNLHTHSNAFDRIATILRRKHACVFLVPEHACVFLVP
jgi:quinol monooxygenase YgiN